MAHKPAVALDGREGRMVQDWAALGAAPLAWHAAFCEFPGRRPPDTDDREPPSPRSDAQ